MILIARRGDLKHSSLRNAAMELEMTGLPCIVFRHAGQGRAHVVRLGPAAG
jgi:hypothetical protein